jgi:hypothetical protein
VGERRGWKNGERWEKGGKKMRETGDKGKKEDKGERGWEKRVEGERKEKRVLEFIRKKSCNRLSLPMHIYS